MAPFELSGPVLLVLAEFALLLLLGGIFMRLLHWHALLEDRREQWLLACQAGAREARLLRRQAEKLDGNWTTLPVGPRLRKKLNVVLWIGKVLKAARIARS